MKNKMRLRTRTYVQFAILKIIRSNKVETVFLWCEQRKNIARTTAFEKSLSRRRKKLDGRVQWMFSTPSLFWVKTTVVFQEHQTRPWKEFEVGDLTTPPSQRILKCGCPSYVFPLSACSMKLCKVISRSYFQKKKLDMHLKSGVFVFRVAQITAFSRVHEVCYWEAYFPPWKCKKVFNQAVSKFSKLKTKSIDFLWSSSLRIIRWLKTINGVG